MLSIQRHLWCVNMCLVDWRGSFHGKLPHTCYCP
jgi:hypothetical protein